MPRKVNSKYKIDRRRTRLNAERSASEESEHDDSKLDPLNASENGHDDDEVEIQSPTQRRRSKRRSPNANHKKERNQENFAETSSDEEVNKNVISQNRRSPRLRSRKKPATARKRSGSSKPSAPLDSDDNDDAGGSGSQSDANEEATSVNRRSPRLRSRKNPTTMMDARRRRSQRGEKDGDVLANLPCPPSSIGRQSAVKSRKNLRKSTEEDVDDGFNENDDSDEDSGGGNDEDSDYEDNENGDDEKEIVSDQIPQKRRKAKRARNMKRATTNRRKPKKAAHSSDEEFILDSDVESDDSSQERSLSDDASTELTNIDDEMIGDPDFSDEDSDHNDVLVKRKQNKQDTDNVANVDNENFGTIDDESDNDDPSNDESSPKTAVSAAKKEILPSPHGVESDREDNPQRSNRFRQKSICPRCPSTEDAITAEALPRLHVCYISPDGNSRVCFKLETLRLIALKSSQLELRVDIDAERQNFLQPPAFRTAMSDDLVDQIASKFGRGALDLHGPYYTKRERKYERKDDNSDGDDDSDDYSYGSNSYDGENNYFDSFETFRDRVRDYFRNGMGSQDLYVCPLCYGRIHRTLVDPNVADKDDSDEDEDDVNDDDDDAAAKEYDAAPSDSVYDPIMVLGHLDNDDMTMASQFCFKRLADVKNHLRQEHDVDTRGIQGNELYKRFRVRAPDGLLQRWLRTQCRGQVRQGHMRMYWSQGNDQIYIHLLDLIEQVKAYTEGDDSSDDDRSENEMSEYVMKAREFFDTFATKASQLWKIMSSPFLKSNDNVNDFIAGDEDYSEEEESGGQHHAALHQQFMNEDSDENDLVHKLQRKYAERNDYDSTSRKSSSSEEELEFVDGSKETEEEGEDDDEDIYDRNGYYSPIEEEKDEWMLQRQSPRKRKNSSVKKERSTDAKIKTPTGKKLFRRKSAPTGTTNSSNTGDSKRKRIFTLEDSSDDDSF